MKRPFPRKVVFLALLSVAINGYLLALLVSSKKIIVPQQFALSTFFGERSQKAPTGLEATLAEYWTVPYEALITQVSDTSHAVCGFQKGELALSVLKARDDVRVDCPHWTSFALSNPQFGGITSISIPVVPNSSDLNDIHAFLLQSKAPFGLKGIYARLKMDKNDSEVKSALLRTDEWLAFSKIFQQISSDDSYALALDIGWDQFARCVEATTRGERVDLQKSLLDWSLSGSQLSALLLVRTYREQVCICLPDNEVIKLLDLLPVEDDVTSLLAVSLLKTPRKPAIWKSCRELLAKRYHDDSFLSISREDLLQKLGVLPKPPLAVVESKAVTVKPVPKQESKKRTVASVQSTYIVRKGETLASIASAMKISLLELKKANPHLVSITRLAPGTAVKIPFGNQSRQASQTDSAQAPVKKQTDSSKTSPKQSAVESRKPNSSPQKVSNKK